MEPDLIVLEIGRQEHSGIRTVGEELDPDLVRNGLAARFAVAGIPLVEHSIPGGGGEPSSVRAEFQVHDLFRLTNRLHHFSTRAPVPDPDGAVGANAGHALAIRTPPQEEDAVSVRQNRSGLGGV